MRRDSLFTIAPARAIPRRRSPTGCSTARCSAAGRASGPFWLSDVTIILPTRRARLALAEEFARRLGGAALLPDIRTFGGEHAEEEPFLPPFDAAAASRRRRRWNAGWRCRGWCAPSPSGPRASPRRPTRPKSLAGRLAGRGDRRPHHRGRADRVRCATLVPDDLAGNWQQIARVPRRRARGLAGRCWPSAARPTRPRPRNERLRAAGGRGAAALWRPPGDRRRLDRLDPATADLLKAIADLPRGALVLPGLDTILHADRSTTLHARGRADRRATRNIGLVKLLRTLGAGRAEVDGARRRRIRAPRWSAPRWRRPTRHRPGPAARERSPSRAALDGRRHPRRPQCRQRSARHRARRPRRRWRERQDRRHRLAATRRWRGASPPSSSATASMVDDAAGTPLFQSRRRAPGAAGAGGRGRQFRAGRYRRAAAQRARSTLGPRARRGAQLADALDLQLARQAPARRPRRVCKASRRQRGAAAACSTRLGAALQPVHDAGRERRAARRAPISPRRCSRSHRRR